jgi:hypothetical protein
VSSGPDPSQPDQFEAKVRQIVYQILNDPLSYPDGMTNWLSTFISLNAPAPLPPVPPK